MFCLERKETDNEVFEQVNKNSNKGVRIGLLVRRKSLDKGAKVLLLSLCGLNQVVTDTNGEVKFF